MLTFRCQINEAGGIFGKLNKRGAGVFINGRSENQIDGMPNNQEET